MTSAKKNIKGFNDLVNKIATAEKHKLDQFTRFPVADERVCVWSDGDWCYECDLDEMSHKSDDFQYIPAQYFFIDNEI
jgi:hypothetical protein